MRDKKQRPWERRAWREEMQHRAWRGWQEHAGQEHGWQWEGAPPVWGEGPPMGPWMHHKKAGAERHPSGSWLFFRFFLAFGLLVLLGCGALALMAAGALFFLQAGSLPQPIPTGEWHPLRWILALGGLALILILVLRRAGLRAARHFTNPLSEVMKAADALAAGDLSARVPVSGSAEFRHLALAFNRMAQALDTADRQRRELLADVAHELRTPLSIIQGNVEGLRDGVYQPTPEHLDLVLDETQKLSRLVEDLRLLTLAEAGQLTLDWQALDVHQLLLDVRDAFGPQAEVAGIALVVEEKNTLPPLVADPQRLGQVLGNLVTNSLRHTPPGGQLTLGAEAGPDGVEGMRLWVADTGEGIPPDELPRIFDRFWRGDPSRSHTGGAGSGLGLAIARGLIEAHGGRIWAESHVGEGTTISVLLPLEPVTSST
ncbi:MAG: HAMP domain-containing histidine kinase [Anaerolineae bacterium]|nr:HAMP domain-containing histidine kinase [Anaerolineae bacterium]